MDVVFPLVITDGQQELPQTDPLRFVERRGRFRGVTHRANILRDDTYLRTTFGRRQCARRQGDGMRFVSFLVVDRVNYHSFVPIDPGP